MSHKMTETTFRCATCCCYCWLCLETKEQINIVSLVPLFFAIVKKKRRILFYLEQNAQPSNYKSFFFLYHLYYCFTAAFYLFGSLLSRESNIIHNRFSSETEKIQNYWKSRTKNCELYRQYFGVAVRKFHKRTSTVYSMRFKHTRM